MMQQMSLDGTWMLRGTDGIRGRTKYAHQEVTDPSRYIDAIVPGEVHLDLMRHGWIADPYVGTNSLAARWVEESIWSYRREFEAPPTALEARSWLVFEGLDLVATIMLNGQEIGKHQNFFYPCRIEVTAKLRPGKNILTVHLDSGLFEVSEKPAKDMGGVFNDQLLHKRHWLRKPQCQFGWDWSTRLINVGIHKPVRLEWTQEAVRIDTLVPLANLSPDLSKGSLEVRLFVEGLLTPPAANTGTHASGANQEAPGVEGEFSVELVGAGKSITVPVKITPGPQRLDARLEVDHPKLWNPVGHGEPYRYTVKATLRVGGKIIGEQTARIGFRHVRVVQDPHPTTGRYFYIMVNGRKIFAKGANFVPADMIFARLDRARYETLVDRALEANFNFLRVWGGGLYESDDFYDLCDEKGILVWQEFIYACARYPTFDGEFNDNAKAEAVYNVRRLASHPSLIIWCGNNENEWGDWSWNWDEAGMRSPDHAFYHISLPRILAREDPTRYYQPSSPFSPDMLPPDQNDVGDQHTWKVGMQNTDFREYRALIPRFPNEGGFLGSTSLPTVRASLATSAGAAGINSLAWRAHDNSVDTWFEPSTTDASLDQWLGKKITDLSLEEFTFWAGLLQGEALREFCESFRRKMFDSAAAIFWMYNDCWPAVRSWTIVDYALRRTPSFHPVRRAMAPVHVALAQEGDQIIVTGINDLLTPVHAELRYGLFASGGTASGGTASGGLDRTIKVELAANAATRLASFPAAQMGDGKELIAFAMLSDAAKLIARSKLVLPFFKELVWAKPNITIKRQGDQAVFTSPTFAWGVCLDLDGDSPLSDNFFDLFPGIPYAIPWNQKTDPKVLFVGNLG